MDERQEKLDFYKEYLRKHIACPNCGSIKKMQTYMCFPVIEFKTYKDENKVSCMTCKWSGIVDNLEPAEELME